MALKEAYFSFLSIILSPILSLQPFIAESIVAVFLIFLTALIYKYTTNVAATHEMKAKQKELTAKMKELQKTNPDEANKVAAEILKLTNQQMKDNMKPMFLTLILVFLFLPWFAEVFRGPMVTLPILGRSVGWLGWYILLSIPLTQLFRKLLGVD